MALLGGHPAILVGVTVACFGFAEVYVESTQERLEKCLLVKGDRGVFQMMWGSSRVAIPPVGDFGC